MEIQSRIGALRNDNISGATACLKQAIEIIRDFTLSPATNRDQALANLHHLISELQEAKPEMASFYRVGDGCLEAAEVGESAQEVLGLVKAHTQTLLLHLDSSEERVAQHAAGLPKEGDQILTISWSAKTHRALYYAHGAKDISAVVCESRPMCEGQDLAKALASEGVPTTLIIDAAALTLLPQCQAVWVGADAIGPDFFVNKIGTLALAVAARHHGIPFYVLADTLKFLPVKHTYKIGPDHPPTEVAAYSNSDLMVRNPYFESIPLSLVTGIVTEKGLRE